MVVLKKILVFILFFYLSSKNSFASQILDYETEKLIYDIIADIKKVNKIKKKIFFRINDNDEINAFVDETNTVHINSGLIQYSDDYVALLSVLAHEIGHIDLNHVSVRKKVLEDNKRNNDLTLLTVIAGSFMTQRPEFIQGSIVSSAAISNRYINFSKEQEIEADIYALKTLTLLNTNSNSVINLLKTIEQKLLEKGFSKDMQRISTHPYFKDRVQLIKFFEKNKNNNFNDDYNQRFNFIKAKFIGYSNINYKLSDLEEPFKTYAKSIRYSKNGDLKMSLKNLNNIIKQNSKNGFLLETKADILFSHGFTKEAVKFYKKNLKYYPYNFYAKIRIFENIKTENLSEYELMTIFQENKDLLFRYFNNKNVLFKYQKLSKQLKKIEWINFLNFYLEIGNMESSDINKKILSFKETKDKDLLKLLGLLENKIS